MLYWIDQPSICDVRHETKKYMNYKESRKMNFKKMLLITGIMAVGLFTAMPATQALANSKNATRQESVENVDYSQIPNLTKRLNEMSFLTDAEKSTLKEINKLVAPNYKKIKVLSAKADKISGKIMKAAKPLNQKYDNIYSKNMELWFKVDGDAELIKMVEKDVEKNTMLTNIYKVENTTALTDAKKKTLLEDAKVLDELDAKIIEIQKKADKARKKLDKLIDKEYAAIEAEYEKHAELLDKISGVMDGQ